jgi:hypothetical protein
MANIETEVPPPLQGIPTAKASQYRDNNSHMP